MAAGGTRAKPGLFWFVLLSIRTPRRAANQDTPGLRRPTSACMCCRAPGPDPRRAASKPAGVQMPWRPPLQVGAEEPGLPLRRAGRIGLGGGCWGRREPLPDPHVLAGGPVAMTWELPPPRGHRLPKALSVRLLHKHAFCCSADSLGTLCRAEKVNRPSGHMQGVQLCRELAGLPRSAPLRPGSPVGPFLLRQGHA